MLDHPALREQIITYIGNKRRLLSFVREGIVELLREEGVSVDAGGSDVGPLFGSGETVETAGPPAKPPRFLDAFAGSGVVSRMARLMGLKVHSNDLEQYAAPLIRPFLTVAPGEAEQLFREPAERLSLAGGNAYHATLNYLNSLEEPQEPGAHYFALHYAPARTNEADPDRERLFYTQENALKIDAILELLNGPAFCDGDGTPYAAGRAREIVLASLLYEMSVHINTSGVMKGYHRGWGGRGGDALLRIMAPIELSPLPLIDGPTGSVSTGPAEDLFERLDLPEQEIIYADPPYNSHQYGSNYHLLTSAVLYDRYDPGPVIRGARAGIRRDHNRSAFCRSLRDAESGSRECEAAFERFVASLRGKYLLVSYNTDGLIPPERMARILARGGRNRVGVRIRDHVKFRGGKNTQSGRRTRELLYRVDLNRRNITTDLDGVVALVAREERLGRLTDSYVEPAALPWSFREGAAPGERVYRNREGTPILRLARSFRVLEVYAAGGEEAALTILEAARLEKPQLMERYIAEGMVEEALHVLRSFKIRKYRREFIDFAGRIREIANPDQRRRLEKMVEHYRV